MSLYKKEKQEYLRQAIDSMLSQTEKPDEIIIVEDGPLNEELYNVLQDYDGKIKRVRVEKNVGLGLALNIGLDVCRNDLVARMDTDDISKPDRCEKQLERFVQNPQLSIVGAWVDEFIDSPEHVISTRMVPTDSDTIYNYAKRRSAFNHPVVMYRKSKVLQQNGYSDLRRNQDVDLFGRMLFAGNKAENINEALLWFRSNADLARRRKSWENTKSYIGTIYRFWKMGYSSFGDFLIVACAQICMYVLPIKVQSYIYKKFLRR